MFELFTTSQTNSPPSEEDKKAEDNGNPTNELSINHVWDLCDLFKGKEESSLEEVQTAQHTHNTRSRGLVAQTNPSTTSNASDTLECSQRKNAPDKAVTTNTIVNKKNSLVDTNASLELDFSIVEDIKRT